MRKFGGGGGGALIAVALEVTLAAMAAVLCAQSRARHIDGNAGKKRKSQPGKKKKKRVAVSAEPPATLSTTVHKAEYL